MMLLRRRAWDDGAVSELRNREALRVRQSMRSHAGDEGQKGCRSSPRFSAGVTACSFNAIRIADRLRDPRPSSRCGAVTYTVGLSGRRGAARGMKYQFMSGWTGVPKSRCGHAPSAAEP